jgi:large subunit ribosomal protein L21
MHIAVIQTGGKQYVVAKGMKLRVEKLPGKEGETIAFSEVLLTSDDKGKVAIGNPFVAGAKVHAKIVSQGRADKVSVVKYKNKIRYSRRVGHRQPFTQLEITTL